MSATPCGLKYICLLFMIGFKPKGANLIYPIEGKSNLMPFMPVFIVAIVFGGIVVALAILCGTFLLTIKIRHGSVSKKGKDQQAQEIKMIQEIYDGLTKMESRVEALETILMERGRKDTHHEDFE